MVFEVPLSFDTLATGLSSLTGAWGVITRDCGGLEDLHREGWKTRLAGGLTNYWNLVSLPFCVYGGGVNQRRNWESSQGGERGQRREDRAFCDLRKSIQGSPNPSLTTWTKNLRHREGPGSAQSDTAELKLELTVPEQKCCSPGQEHPAQPRASSVASE